MRSNGRQIRTMSVNRALYARKGDQVWNENRTEGYEFTEDIEPCTPVFSRQLKALGDAKPPAAHQAMPEWLGKILVQGGYKEYTLRHPEDIKEAVDE